MIALCAYVPGGLRHETEQALTEHWKGGRQFVALQPGDTSSYPNLIAGYWQLARGFAIVEQDIVIRADVYETFTGCPEPYCAYPYPWLTHIGPALGCTRFRAEFLTEFPDAMRKVQARNVSWRQTDIVLMRHILAGEYGQQPHVHLPPVEHLNPRKQTPPGTPITTIVPTR